LHERKRVQKWLKPRHLNVLAGDEAGVLQEWGEWEYTRAATGSALAAPIKRASWFYPAARSKQWRNVLEDTRGGRLWQLGKRHPCPMCKNG